MQWPAEARRFIFTRHFNGRNERVEWIRQGDSVWIVVNGKEAILRPEDWRQAWFDLQAHGYVEVFPTDRRKLKAEKQRVIAVIREAFAGVTLGDGIGLNEAEGLDNYASKIERESLRAKDEKFDWSAIPSVELNRCFSSLSYFDAEGMCFHLPAYMIAQLQDQHLAVDVYDHLTYTFEGLERLKSKFATVSVAQREAISQFLRLRLSDPDYYFEHSTIETVLRDYWNAPSSN